MTIMTCPRCGGKLTKGGNCFKCGARPIVFNSKQEKFHIVINNHPVLTKDGIKYGTVHLNASLTKPFLYITSEPYDGFTYVPINKYEMNATGNILPLNKDDFILYTMECEE